MDRRMSGEALIRYCTPYAYMALLLELDALLGEGFSDECIHTEQCLASVADMAETECRLVVEERLEVIARSTAVEQVGPPLKVPKTPPGT